MLALGIDLGGTAIKTAVVDVTGDVVGTGEEKTPAKQGVDACVEAMMAAADGAFVGTCLEKGGWAGRIDEQRVREYAEIVAKL
mgnify:CR=1 FL=1